MNVLVDKQKIDLLANAISDKSGEPITMTLEEMVSAVDGIAAGGGGITPSGNIDITQAGTTDVTNYETATVANAELIDPLAPPIINSEMNVTSSGEVLSSIEFGGNLPFATQGGFVIPSDNINVYNSANLSLQLPTQAAVTITPTTQVQTAVAAGKFTTGAVTVAAMPTGTAGTPTATKGTVSNHSVSVTPSVTNTSGYITGSTKTGTAITVSASELVSGSETKTTNGTYDVTNLAQLVVNVSGGGGANFDTVTTTNANNQNTSISFTLPSGRTPKAFFCRLTSQLTRNSSSRYYYVENIRWDGTTNGGVAGRCFYMYSGQLTNITSGYSHSQSNTTYTLTSTGSRSASPGSFYNGTYELVYVY